MSDAVIPPAGRGARSAIERLLAPRSVAIAGVSQSPGSLGGGVLANLQRFGFAGDIHIIHPTRAEIGGRVCVSSARALPDGVDCVVLAIPGAGVMDAVQGCAARGVGGVIVFSAGFAETGDEGRARQREIAAVATANGMALAGPNCLGIVNYVDGVCLTFGVAEPRRPTGPGLAIVSQSGAMASVIRVALHARDVDVAITVSTGNEAVCGAEDFIAHLLDDANVKAIAVVAEEIRQPRRFIALARRARDLGKPIVLLHPGRSAAAQESALTHTGALTGNYDVMRTLVADAGVAIVETMDELVDVAEMLVRFETLPAKGTAIFGESGAFKSLMLDLAEAVDLELPQPDGATHDALAALAPGLILPTNPVDLTAQALVDPDLYEKALPPLNVDDAYGSIVLALILSSQQLAARKTEPILKVLRALPARKPMVFAMLGEDQPIDAGIVAAFRQLGIPFLRSADRTVRALALVTQLGAVWAAPHEPYLAAVSPGAPKLAAGTIPEYRAKDLLAAAGLPMPKRGLATTLAAATAIADRIGYPIALKAQSCALSHKSDAGGVVLGLGTSQALAAGWARLQADVAAARPGLVLDGILVEQMAPKGLELIVGARNDPRWGPVLVVGLGGVLAEALSDVRVLPHDLPPDRIAAELRRLKGSALLDGFRGAPAVDVAAAALAVARLGQFVGAHPEIVELDINPLLVLPAGQGVLALDAVMVVA